MKFEKKYPSATSTDRFDFGYSFVTKGPKLGVCRCCNSMTKWFDGLFQVNVCGEECGEKMWSQFKADQKKANVYDNFEHHFEMVKQDLKRAAAAKNEWKDIIVVVRNQFDYFKQTIESVMENTKKFHLYIWDNGSRADVQDYINKLLASYNPETNTDWKITTMRSEENTGFIFPNNELVALGDSPYIILLNSDTKVFAQWDTAMLAVLQQERSVAQVGYWGGHMGPDGRGFGGANGYEIDYVPGWCFAIERAMYERFGLFDDEHLRFAYCEDADLSLRLKESGRKIYALYPSLVHHFQNKTITEVEKEGQIDVRASFEYNHAYIKERWKDYLANERVLLKRKDSHVSIPSEGVNH